MMGRYYYLWLLFLLFVINLICYRQGISKSPNDYQMSYSETLTKYEKFVKEMSVINITWTQCQQLVEKYDEKQARQ